MSLPGLVLLALVWSGAVWLGARLLSRSLAPSPAQLWCRCFSCRRCSVLAVPLLPARISAEVSRCR